MILPLFNSNFEKNISAQNSKISEGRERRIDNNKVLLVSHSLSPFPDLLQYEISWNKAPGIEKQSEVALKISDLSASVL